MDIVTRMKEGNRSYIEHGNDALRKETAQNGQHPYAVVICCSDSRVIPEQIFRADIGDLFVIRVAGNVLDRHQLGSVEYAVEHLNCRLVLMLGHTGCGAVGAALKGEADGHISFITNDIQKAIGMERDPDEACRLNVAYGVGILRKAFLKEPDAAQIEIKGAIYDIRTGAVDWLEL